MRRPSSGGWSPTLAFILACGTSDKPADAPADSAAAEPRRPRPVRAPS